MDEIYPRWVAAHGVMIVSPVHWYQAPASLKLMIDRLVCADGGNPDPTTTGGKNPAKAKTLDLEGWDYLPEGRRVTACVSTQVGCPVACVFCASGLDGLKRNLTAGEIVEQVLMLPKRPTHVVIMGIGEPLLNFTPLVSALRTMREAVGIGYNKITLSTAGVVDKIPTLVKARTTPNLAISLHAPDDALREKLVPGLRKWKIADLVAAGRAYREETGKDVTFEYVLLAGVNDAPEQATVLARRLHGVGVKVNVIPFNGVPGLPYQRPEKIAIDRFVRAVGAGGVPVTVRRQRGDDASAACGQLRAAFA